MRRRAREHAGFVLLAVLTVSMLASLTVVSLLYRSRAEVTASTASRGSWQAMRAAMSGIERAIQVVAANGYDRARWHDVPEIFERQLVEEEGFERWYFTVYSPDEVALGDVRSGVEDQSARFRIGALDHDTLARLANIDVTRVDQLLADQDSALDSELGAYLTSWRTEYTIDRRYRRQVDINRDIDPVATLEIPEAAIEFIAEARRLADDRAAFRHPVELLDATLKISGEDGKERTIKSGIDTTGIHSILDRCRTDPHDSYATHTINVNTASAEILALVKGVDESLAQSIVTKRRGVDPRRRPGAHLGAGTPASPLMGRRARDGSSSGALRDPPQGPPRPRERSPLPPRQGPSQRRSREPHLLRRAPRGGRSRAESPPSPPQGSALPSGRGRDP